MEKITFEVFNKKTNEKVISFEWPVMPLSTIDNSNLTKKQKKNLKDIIKRQLKDIKHHFKNDGAWDLDSHWYLADIINSFLGFNLDDLFITQSCYQSNLGYAHKNNKSLFTNKKDKVFYDVQKNELYIDTQSRCAGDIQIGDF